MTKDERKLKIAFLYTSHNNKFFHDGLKYDDNLHYFFFEGLAKSPRIEFISIDIHPAMKLDCSNLQGADIIVIDAFAVPLIYNLYKIDCPKFLRSPDPYDFNLYFHDFCNLSNIEHLFYSPCESSFRRIVDTPLQYHQIIHGIREPETKVDFENRSDSILFTGCVGNLNDRFYHLRKVIQNAESEHSEFEFVPPYNIDNSGQAYRVHLSWHKAAIAATRQYFSLKYLEIPAAGTLCFMEDDGLNGIRELGFVDDVNAIFINEDNFDSQFLRFIGHPDAEEAEDIAKAGHDLVMSKYENSIQVDKLINIFYSVL